MTTTTTARPTETTTTRARAFLSSLVSFPRSRLLSRAHALAQKSTAASAPVTARMNEPFSRHTASTHPARAHATTDATRCWTLICFVRIRAAIRCATTTTTTRRRMDGWMDEWFRGLARMDGWRSRRNAMGWWCVPARSRACACACACGLTSERSTMRLGARA